MSSKTAKRQKAIAQTEHESIRIAREIPPDRFRQMCCTPSLAIEFEVLRSLHQMMADEWQWNMKGRSLLLEKREAGKLKPLQYEHLFYYVQSRWDFLQVLIHVFSAVKKKFNALKRNRREHRSVKFPFKGTADLFKEILESEAWCNLQSKKQGQTISNYYVENHHRLLLDISVGNKASLKEENLEGMRQKLYPVKPEMHPVMGKPWKEFVIEVYLEEAAKEQIVADLVSRATFSGKRLAQVEQTIGAKKWHAREKWESGEKV